MAITKKTYAQRVARGAAYLDGLDMLEANLEQPWFDVVDLDRLDLSEGCDCVLGQIVKTVDYSTSGFCDVVDYWNNRGSSRIAEQVGFDHVLSHEEAVDLGFHVSDNEDISANDYEWANLTHEWRKLILQRRAAAEVQDALKTADT